MNSQLLILSLSTSLLFHSCSSDPQVPILDLVILQDVTDKEINRVKYTQVKSIFDFKTYLHYELKVRYRELSDVSYGLIKETTLPQSNPNTITTPQRKREISRFLTSTKALLSQDEDIKTTKDKSIIFPAVAMELNRLSKESQATNKIVLIYSDLIENNDFFSLFFHEHREALLHTPNKVLEHFQASFPLEDLTGISVYIFYQAKPSQDELFYEMTKLYAYLLGARGAEVHISSSPVTNYTIHQKP